MLKTKHGIATSSCISWQPQHILGQCNHIFRSNITSDGKRTPIHALFIFRTAQIYLKLPGMVRTHVAIIPVLVIHTGEYRKTWLEVHNIKYLQPFREARSEGLTTYYAIYWVVNCLQIQYQQLTRKPSKWLPLCFLNSMVVSWAVSECQYYIKGSAWTRVY